MPTIDILQDRIREHLAWGPLKDADKFRFLVLALCGEAGELANLVKKDWRGDAGVVERRAKIIEEITDVANYTFMLAEALGFDLPAHMLDKLYEVEQRPEWRKAV